MGRISGKRRPSSALTKELRKAMIDRDLGYDDLGDATGRAWRERIAHPERMNIETYWQLCRRLCIDPAETLDKATKGE